MIYDLHVHTTASDGEDAPETVILRAIKAGLDGLAITDHDTVEGLEPAQQYIYENQLNIDFIPGIELNTDYGEDEVHILGYFIDYKNENLLGTLHGIQDERYKRTEKIVSKLKSLGINIDFEQVKNIAGGDSIGRPHIARVLYNNGYASSPEEAFRNYVGYGMPGYVPRYKFLPAEAIAIIKQTGGIAVLAHPGLIKEKKAIMEIINLGIEGLEIYYPEHTQKQIADLRALAANNKLLITGGSDYHGPGSSANRSKIGAAFIDENSINNIKEYYHKKIE